MSTGAAAIEPEHRERLMFRLGGSYLVNLARLVVRYVDADIITSLVFLGVARANAIQPTRRGPIAYPYLSDPGVPADSQRRPVSIYAVAKELNLPYETARRHARRLQKAQLLEAVPGGLIAPARSIISTDAAQAARESWLLTLDLVDDLGAHGVVSTGALPPAAPENAQQVLRLAVSYFVTATCDMARYTKLDVLSVLILRTIAVGNVEHLTRDKALSVAYADLGAIPGDAERRPISAFAVAKFLAIPYETARRHIMKLIDQGLVERREHGGLVVPTQVIASPQMIAAVPIFNANTTAFLDRLAQAGVGPQPGPRPRRSVAEGVRRPRRA